MVLSPLIFLAGIFASFATRSRRRPKSFVRLAFLFVTLATLSTLWSPITDPTFSGDLWAGDFGISAPALRIVAMSLAMLMVIAATLGLQEAQAERLSKIMIPAIGIHAVVIILLALFTSQALTLAAPLSDPVFEAPQNLIRNANLFALGFPLFIAGVLMVRFEGNTQRWVILGSICVAVAACLKLSADSAALGFIAGSFMFGLVYIWPRNGFRIIFGAAAAKLLAMPFLVSLAHTLLGGISSSLPPSFQARLWGWQLINEKIADRLWFGHGIEAAGTWRETYGERPEWLSEVPARFENISIVAGHPHNMALEIWAETGLVGACIFAAALSMLGMAMPWPYRLSLPARFAVCGVLGAALTQYSFAYSLWNDAFWAGLTLAITGCILIAKIQKS